MRKLKLFFACMLLTLLSVGQVWATGTAATMTAGTNGSACTVNDDNGIKVGTSKAGGDMSITVPAGATTLHLYAAAWKGVTDLSLNISGATTSPTSIALTADAGISNNSPFTLSGNASNFKFDITLSNISAETTITFTSSAAKRFVVWGATYETSSGGGGTPDPTLSLDPTSKEFEASENSAQAIALTASNFSSAISTVTCGFYSEAACTTSISRPSWVNEPTVNDGKTQVSVNVADNDGAARQTWMKITASDGSKSASAVFAISQKKYSAPTGTFNLFSGDLVEGDYVLYYSGKALQASVNSDRWGCLNVTPSENKITNPDASIVWHIAQISETTNWTLYNAEENKYAASTGAKNKGALIADGTDANAVWSVSGTYDFINVARSTGSDPNNKYLRYNSQNADNTSWACYASGTGGALTLYKKSDGKPAAPTFLPAAGSYLEAQSVTISAAEGASIYYTTDGSTPTASSTAYTGAIPVSSTTTIKAVAVKDAVVGHVATATYTITSPLSVAAAIALIPNANDQVDDQFVEGYVCTAGTSVSSGKMTYYISADGSETNRLQIYKGKNLDNADFSEVSDLAIGDKVVIFGQLKNFSGTYEMNDGNYIARRTAKGALSSVVVSGTPTKTAYSSGDAFAPAGLVVTATYASGYAIDVASQLADADWSASPATVTESGNISVTATYGGTTSAAYQVPVTVLAATLESITLSYDAVEVYQGKDLPKPTVTAHWSDKTTSDVTALAEFTGYNPSTTGNQTITVSYEFGESGEKTATYTVTVNPIYGVELAASVAKDLIETVVGNTESTSDMIARGIVSQVGSIDNNTKGLTYYISDDGTTTNQLEIYKGKYLDNADFTNANKLKVGDEVVVTGKVIYYNNNTAEFASGKSQVTSLARTPNFEIEDVASFEVGSADLAVSALTITQDGEGAVTLESSDNTDAVTIVDGKLHAEAAGDATITANLAANGIYKASSTTFDVHVIAATVKYAISFDANGGSGDAPEFASEAAAGANITLPANTYTYTGHIFTGWIVTYVDGESVEHEVTVTANAFTMPAYNVTVKALWETIPVWAYTYTSNVAISSNTAANVTIGGTDYDAAKTSKGATATITLPQGVTKIHLHLVAWSGEAQTVSVTGDCFDGAKNLTILANSGVSGQGTTYDLGESGVDYYFSLTPDHDVTENEVITISAASQKRFVLFGVNQEGGIVPVLDHITVSGDLTKKSGYETGDELDLGGLTVEAVYTLGGAEQSPVDITDKLGDGLTLTYDPLVVGQTVVTITATYENKSDDINITLDEAVVSGEQTITTDVSSRSWTNVQQNTTPAAKTIKVTLKNVDAVTAALSGTGASVFSIDKQDDIVNNDVITISITNTATIGTYSATLTLTDKATENPASPKAVTLSLTVVEPSQEETPVSTTSRWVEATDIDDDLTVLITGVSGGNTYAMGVQNNNNRAAVKGTLSQDVFTPGENTMAFTLVEQNDGTYALRTSNGKYLYAASSSSNNLKTQDDVDENAKWTLTTTSAVAKGSTNRNVMQLNGTTIFSCYASANQTGIKLYMPEGTIIPTKYSVTYALNDGSGTTPTQKAVKENTVITLHNGTTNITAPSGQEFDGWLCNIDDVKYAGGASYTMTAANTTFTAQWKDAPTHTLSYNAGGATGDVEASATVHKGSSVTLASQGDLTKGNDYEFQGWSYNHKLYDAGSTFVMPDEDVVLTARWRKKYISTEKMRLVTDVNALVDGLEFTLGCSYGESNFAMAGDITGTNKYMNSVSGSGISLDGDIASFTNSVIILIANQVEGGWTIRKDETNYLTLTGTDIKWDTQANATVWTISFSAGNVQIASGNNKMQFNSSSPRFKTYTSNQTAIQMFSKATVVTTNANISDLGYTEGEAIVASGANVTLTIDEPTTVPSITAQNGATIVVEETTSATSLKVDEESKIEVTAPTTVNEVFSVAATMGGGKSGQLGGVANVTLAQNVEAYFDITLGDNANPDHWHAIAVPFPVDAINGVYDAETGEKLTNEVNYAIMDYHGEIRAQGLYGWKKIRTTLMPGVFYLMTVDGNTKTFRFKMSGITLPTGNDLKLSLHEYAVSTGIDGTNGGWNGVANPTLEHGQVGARVQVLNPATYTFEPFSPNSCNFVVGTPFFYQARSDSSMTMVAASGDVYYAPRRANAMNYEDILIRFGNNKYKDRFYISAREDALSTYEIGRDLLKMTMTNTPNVPQIFGKAYGHKLCIVDAQLANNQAIYDLDLYAPAAGTYSISAQQVEGATLYVTYNGAIVWNLSLGDYELDLTRGTTTGYGLLLVAQPNQMPTGLDTTEGVSGDAVQKILLNGQLYILRDGHLFDAVGHEMK